MLKRCAVVLGVAVASLLVASPMAFAAPGDPPDSSNDQSGLIAVGDVSLLNGANVCPNVGLLLPIGNLLGILGGPSTAAATSGDSTITCSSTVSGKHVGQTTGDGDDVTGPALPGVPALPAAGVGAGAAGG